MVLFVTLLRPSALLAVHALKLQQRIPAVTSRLKPNADTKLRLETKLMAI